VIFLTHTISHQFSISSLVPSYEEQSPSYDEAYLGRMGNNTSYYPRNITLDILSLEDIAAAHVAHTVSYKDPAACYHTLVAPSGVRRDQFPCQKGGDNEGHGDNETGPFTPLIGIVAGK
jgi:hypothetical protein